MLLTSFCVASQNILLHANFVTRVKHFTSLLPLSKAPAAAALPTEHDDDACSLLRTMCCRSALHTAYHASAYLHCHDVQQDQAWLFRR